MLSQPCNLPNLWFQCLAPSYLLNFLLYLTIKRPHPLSASIFHHIHISTSTGLILSVSMSHHILISPSACLTILSVIRCPVWCLPHPTLHHNLPVAVSPLSLPWYLLINHLHPPSNPTTFLSYHSVTSPLFLELVSFGRLLWKGCFCP